MPTLYLVIGGRTDRDGLRSLFHPYREKHGIPVKAGTAPPPVESVRYGDLVLGMGTAASERLCAEGALPNSTLSRTRDKVFSYGEGHLITSWDLGYADINPDRWPDIIWDVKRAFRWLVKRSWDPELGNYRYVTDFRHLVDEIKRRHDRTGLRVPLSFDLETLGFDPWAKATQSRPDARIISVAFSMAEGTGEVLYVDGGTVELEVLDQIRWLVLSRKVRLVGANLKFDCAWLKVHWGLDVGNFSFDTHLVGTLLDENRSNSLEVHAKVYTDLGGYDDRMNSSYDKGRMDKVPKEDLLDYAAGDVDAALRVYRIQREMLLQDRSLANFYVKGLHRIAKAVSAMEVRGVVVDRGRMAEAASQLRTRQKEAHDAALAEMSDQIKKRHSQAGTSLTRADFVRDWLFLRKSEGGLGLHPFVTTEKTGAASISNDHLNMFLGSKADAFIVQYQNWRKVKKSLSTYVDGFMKHLRSDGRFHSSYFLGRSAEGGTVTGRLSAKDPAMQTLPAHTKDAKLLRTPYIPPPGHVIVHADYSQGELRIAACLANEKVMIESYRNGIDLHLVMAAETQGTTVQKLQEMLGSDDPAVREKGKLARFGGKAGNFGFLYGMQPDGYVTYARSTFGVRVTKTEATRQRKVYFETYPSLAPWHDRYIDHARRHGYVRSPLGRIRRLPNINHKVFGIRGKDERRAVNSPVQSTLTDMTGIALGMLHERYPELWCCIYLHDGLYFYVKEDEVDVWTPRIKETMEGVPLEEFGWKPQLKFEVDVEIFTDSLADEV